MASPAFGLNNQQTQNWANSFQNNLRKQGQDPAQFGFGGGSAFTQGGQQPSQRTPAKQPQNFSAYSQPSTKQASPFSYYAPQQMGNFAQQQMGLPSFQFSATDSFGNTYNNPAALTAQQGAMAQALNQQRAQQIQSGNIGQLNPMAAYQQAQNMVQGGWTNPFAQQPAAPTYQQWNDRGMGPPLLAAGYKWGPDGQAQPIQPPSQGAPYGTGLGSIGTSLESHGYLGPAGGYGSHPRDNNYGRGWGPGVPIFKGSAPSHGRDASQMLGPPRQAQPQPSPDAYYPGDVFFPPAGQAQPVQPPSQGTPYGQPAWRPKYGEYSPTTYYNDSGEMFSGSMSFAPGTSEADRSKAYGNWAEKEGYFKRGSDGSKLPRQGTQYGTPPDQRGGPRTNQFIDGDGDGVDDRDQDGPGMPRYGQPTRRGTFERDAVGMPILRAPQVWTNPSDPEWFKRELQSKPDTRPVVWDEANRRYIKNPYLAGGPARPDAAALLQRYEPGFAYARPYARR